MSARRTSCINHENSDSLIILRASYLDIMKSGKGSTDRAAALLLGFFEYWHNVKVAMNGKASQFNDIAEKHGEVGNQDITLYQWHSTSDIQDSMMGLVGRPAISDGIKLLVSLGFISKHKNPNPRYAFDNTTHYLLHPDAVNNSLHNRSSMTAKQKLSYDNADSVGTIPETSSETSSETPEESAPARDIPDKETISEETSPGLPTEPQPVPTLEKSPEILPESFTPFKRFLEANANSTWVNDQQAWEEVWEEITAKSTTGMVVRAIEWATKASPVLVGEPESFINGPWLELWKDFMLSREYRFIREKQRQEEVIAKPASFTEDFTPFLKVKTGGTWSAQLHKWKGQWGKLEALTEADCNLSGIFKWATKSYRGGIGSVTFFVDDDWPKILAAFKRDQNL